MSQKKYDLAVGYRICPHMSRTPPPVFADSKYKMSALCLRSFKESLGSLKVKMTVLLDNCPPEYEELFTSLWAPEDLVLMRFPGVGNMGTLVKQIEVMMAQEDADYVYLAEDDYTYLPGRFHLMLDLLKNNPDVDFCTPYDHLDYYLHDFHRHRMRLKVEQGQVWKTQNGTTGTFLTRAPILRETGAVLASIARKSRLFGYYNTDAGIWLSLTKHHVFNLYDLITQPFISRFRGWSLACVWYYNWRQVLFGRRYTLWVPVPSLATHMAAGLEAPHVNWKEQFQRLEKQITQPAN